MTRYLSRLTSPPPPEEPSTTVWLVNGVLTIADSELVTALRELSRDNQGENGATIWMRKCRQRRAGVRA